MLRFACCAFHPTQTFTPEQRTKMVQAFIRQAQFSKRVKARVHAKREKAARVVQRFYRNRLQLGKGGNSFAEAVKAKLREKRQAEAELRAQRRAEAMRRTEAEMGEKQLRAAAHFESKLTEEGGAPLVPDADRAANASCAPEAAVNAGLSAPETPPPLKVNSENRCLICNSADDEEVGSDPPHLSCSLIHPHSLTSHACQMSRCL
jgi:hypothetical protein